MFLTNRAYIKFCAVNFILLNRRKQAEAEVVPSSNLVSVIFS